MEPRPVSRRPAWLPDAGISVVLYLGAVVLDLVSAAAVDAQRLLSGEELSVSMVDVVSVPGRFQPTPYATNFASHLWFWAFSELDPSFDLFYGRTAKAVAMGLLAPLLYLTARRRLGCGRGPAVLGAGVAVLLPGVSAFGWMATENGLEALWGLAALYVATSRRRVWVAAPVLAGVAVSAYGAGLAWAAATLAVCGVRLIREPGRVPTLLWLVAATAAGVEIVFFPMAWWRGGGAVVVGGGAVGDVDPGAALSRLGEDLAVRGHSYYYFTSTPALGALWLAVVLGVAVIVAALRRPRIWPWLLTVAATVAVAAFSAGPPGIRRAIAIPVVAALALGVAVDIGIRRHRTVLGVVLATAAAALVVGPLTDGYLDHRAAWASGAARLPHDFPFPIPAGRTMPEEFAVLTRQLNTGRTTYEQMAQEREGERTLATIWLLAERRGRDLTGLPGPAQIAVLVRQGPRCSHDCQPVPGRP